MYYISEKCCSLCFYFVFLTVINPVDHLCIGAKINVNSNKVYIIFLCKNI